MVLTPCVSDRRVGRLDPRVAWDRYRPGRVRITGIVYRGCLGDRAFGRSSRYTFTMHRVCLKPILGLILGLLLAVVSPASAQISEVRLEVPRENLGLAGQTRLGAWTPIRLSLENTSSEPRQIICRWLMKDSDGDRVMAQRRATLDALTTQDAWVYGPLPIRTNPHDTWAIQVLNEDGTTELARAESLPAKAHPPGQRLIGILGTQDMGLNAYTYQATFHENPAMVTGLTLATLPDRWYGLSAVDTLVWSRTGGDPDDPLLTSNTQQALRQWVRRGGHLVIVLPSVGESWSGSGLSDLLPVKSGNMYRLEERPPNWLGAPRGEEILDVDITTFNVKPGDGVDIIKTHKDQDEIIRPVIVAKRFGTGRVTLVGFDFADSRYAQMGMPSGKYPVWNDIFMWQAPVFSQSRIDADLNNVKMSRPGSRSIIPLDRFIPGRVSMRGTAATALLAAILVFGLYWVAAGPISFFALKSKNAVRHSWVVFVGIVLGFTAISWAGAWLFAPSNAAISHFTVLTANADSPTVHAHSWFSLYVPSFTEQQITIDPDHPNARNTLASPGLIADGSDTGFVDPQAYSLDVGNPNTANIPFRSTAKQFEADFLGRVDQAQAGMTNPFVLPQGDLEIKQAVPAGKISHGLPGSLTNVRVIYCPGDNESPQIWQYPSWAPNEVLELSKLTKHATLISRPADPTYSNRSMVDEGYLGSMVKDGFGQKLIGATGTEGYFNNADTVQYIELLSFFDTLPPPDFADVTYPYCVAYQRELGRQLDITKLLAGRRLIVMGHLVDSPIPVPMTVDDEELPSSGWTVVRWVYDFK